MARFVSKEAVAAGVLGVLTGIVASGPGDQLKTTERTVTAAVAGKQESTVHVLAPAALRPFWLSDSGAKYT